MWRGRDERAACLTRCLVVLRCEVFVLVAYRTKEVELLIQKMANFRKNIENMCVPIGGGTLQPAIFWASDEWKCDAVVGSTALLHFYARPHRACKHNITSAWCSAKNGNNCCQGECSHMVQQHSANNGEFSIFRAVLFCSAPCVAALLHQSRVTLSSLFSQLSFSSTAPPPPTYCQAAWGSAVSTQINALVFFSGKFKNIKKKNPLRLVWRQNPFDLLARKPGDHFHTRAESCVPLSAPFPVNDITHKTQFVSSATGETKTFFVRIWIETKLHVLPKNHDENYFLQKKEQTGNSFWASRFLLSISTKHLQNDKINQQQSCADADGEIRFSDFGSVECRRL